MILECFENRILNLYSSLSKWKNYNRLDALLLSKEKMILKVDYHNDSWLSNIAGINWQWCGTNISGGNCRDITEHVFNVHLISLRPNLASSKCRKWTEAKVLMTLWTPPNGFYTNSSSNELRTCSGCLFILRTGQRFVLVGKPWLHILIFHKL